MVLLFSPNPSHLSLMRSALPRLEQVAIATDWMVVEREWQQHRCSIVCLEWLRPSPFLPKLLTFKERHPHHPVVLVTRFVPDNARLLKNVPVEEVIWFREIDQELGTAVMQTCTQRTNLVGSLTALFDEAKHLPPLLRSALVCACHSEPPVCSINQLASAVGCDRRTLWCQWQQAIGKGVTERLRLEDMLHWLLLLRAVGLKTPSRSWIDTAGKIGVSPKTLSRWAKQLAGIPLKQLAEGEWEQGVPLFHERIYKLLLP